MTERSLPVRARRSLARAALLLSAAGALAHGCGDPPFTRANPFDAEMPLEMTIVGGRDTVTAASQSMLFQLVTTPAVVGYEPVWTSLQPSYLLNIGYGRFSAARLPTGTPLNVVITAEFAGRVASRTIVFLPAP